MKNKFINLIKITFSRKTYRVDKRDNKAYIIWEIPVILGVIFWCFIAVYYYTDNPFNRAARWAELISRTVVDGKSLPWEFQYVHKLISSYIFGVFYSRFLFAAFTLSPKRSVLFTYLYWLIPILLGLEYLWILQFTDGIHPLLWIHVNAALTNHIGLWRMLFPVALWIWLVVLLTKVLVIIFPKRRY